MIWIGGRDRREGRSVGCGTSRWRTLLMMAMYCVTNDEGLVASVRCLRRVFVGAEAVAAARLQGARRSSE